MNYNTHEFTEPSPGKSPYRHVGIARFPVAGNPVYDPGDGRSNSPQELLWLSAEALEYFSHLAHWDNPGLLRQGDKSLFLTAYYHAL
jgi:hypothetical protein